MQRRGLLGLAFAWPLHAGAPEEIEDVFAALATALSGGDPYDFMAPFDRSMPAYEQFRAGITALLEQNEVLTSIDLLSRKVQADEATVEADWLLQIRSRQPAGPVTRRNEKVTCRLVRRRGKWKIVDLSPRAFFAPP